MNQNIHTTIKMNNASAANGIVASFFVPVFSAATEEFYTLQLLT